MKFEEWQEIDIRIGEVKVAERLKGTELYVLTVDFGSEQRTIVTKLAKWYTAEELTGKKIPFLLSLEPRKIFGIESQGMMVNVFTDRPIFLAPEEDVPRGTRVC